MYEMATLFLACFLLPFCKNLVFFQLLQIIIDFSLLFKGSVQRKLTGVLSGINRKLMICHCSDGYSFLNLKGLCSLKKQKRVFSVNRHFVLE
jgi:hypothetical protein